MDEIQAIYQADRLDEKSGDPLVNLCVDLVVHFFICGMGLIAHVLGCGEGFTGKVHTLEKLKMERGTAIG